MNTQCLKSALLVAALVAATTACAQQPSTSPTFGPFDGSGLIDQQGYQELELSANRWYVAYQGNRQTSPAWVEAAWAARAAQLCATVNARHFVELRYSFETVAADDVPLSMLDADLANGHMRKAAGAVYIPIYTPSRAPVTLNAPAKLAAIRCVAESTVVTDRSRLVSGDESRSRAKSLGIFIP